MSSDDGYFTCDDEPDCALRISPSSDVDTSSSDTARSVANTVLGAPTVARRKKKTTRHQRLERRHRSFAARKLQALARAFLVRRRCAQRRALAHKSGPAEPSTAPVAALHFRCTRCCAPVRLNTVQVAALARQGTSKPEFCYMCFNDRRQRPKPVAIYDCAVCASSTRVRATTHARMRERVPAHLPLVCPSCHRHARGRGVLQPSATYVASAERVQRSWRWRRAVHVAKAVRAAVLVLQAATRGMRARRCARGLHVLRVCTHGLRDAPPPPRQAAAPHVPEFAPTREFFELLVAQRVDAALEQQRQQLYEQWCTQWDWWQAQAQ